MLRSGPEAQLGTEICRRCDFLSTVNHYHQTTTHNSFTVVFLMMLKMIVVFRVKLEYLIPLVLPRWDWSAVEYSALKLAVGFWLGTGLPSWICICLCLPKPSCLSSARYKSRICPVPIVFAIAPSLHPKMTDVSAFVSTGLPSHLVYYPSRSRRNFPIPNPVYLGLLRCPHGLDPPCSRTLWR